MRAAVVQPVRKPCFVHHSLDQCGVYHWCGSYGRVVSPHQSKDKNNMQTNDTKPKNPNKLHQPLTYGVGVQHSSSSCLNSPSVAGEDCGKGLASCYRIPNLAVESDASTVV